jgi:hypothetical protein
MPRKQLDNFLEQERRIKLRASITRNQTSSLDQPVLTEAMKKKQISRGNGY